MIIMHGTLQHFTRNAEDFVACVQGRNDKKQSFELAGIKLKF
jgi:hypothetical protein